MNVLVCITPQSNSKRLIDKGAEIIDNGKLHIMHMEMGDNIFSSDNAADMLEELFDYGKSKGGEVHFLTGVHFLQELKKFCKKKNIGCLVLGEPLDSRLETGVKEHLPKTEIVIVKRLTQNLRENIL